MNHSYRDFNHNNNHSVPHNYNSPGGMRNYPVVASNHHRRGHSFNAVSPVSDDSHSLHLFSRTSSLPLSDDSQGEMRLGKISVGSVKLPARSGLDDLLSSSDGGKHDYDWLLTPPETPLCASSERSEFQSNSAAPRNSVSRSISANKPSRLSTSQLDSNHTSRPARSSSVTCSSVSLNNGHSSHRSPSSIVNTSSASVSSYIRPSSPSTRSTSTVGRPSTPSSRKTSSRSSTPSKVHSVPTFSSADKTRPSQSSRPSTPSSRSQISANLTPTATRSSSRSSTPTRRNIVSTSSPSPSISVSTGRGLSNGRSQTSISRPSSPNPRIRTQQPVIPPDFPHVTPPNLRTTLSDRPVSTGRSRPGASLSSKVHPESPSSVRRPSSPVVSRGRSVEPQGRGSLYSNGHNSGISEPRKSTYVSDSMRKPVKASSTTENGGFGRTISKKSIDMAVRHMDIRNGSGNSRLLPSTSLFPQSIRPGPSNIQTGYGSSSPTSIQSNGCPSLSNNGFVSENGTYANGYLENGKKEDNVRLIRRLAEVDLYESTRYDTILLKEDVKNTTWLHSVDDKSDQFSMFDNGFESLPEPFGLS